MNEQEKQLRELMKGCEGMTIYSVIEGNVRFDGFENDEAIIHIERNDIDVHLKDLFLPSGICMLFPSEKSYKDNLDPIIAWEKWQEERNINYTVEVRINVFSVNKKGETTKHFPFVESVTGISEKVKDNAIREIKEIIENYQLPF